MFMFPPPSSTHPTKRSSVRPLGDTSDSDFDSDDSDAYSFLSHTSRDTPRPHPLPPSFALASSSSLASAPTPRATMTFLTVSRDRSPATSPHRSPTGSPQQPKLKFPRGRPSMELASTRINGREILNHVQHYVVLDNTRASAFAPVQHKAALDSVLSVTSSHSRTATQSHVPVLAPSSAPPLPPLPRASFDAASTRTPTQGQLSDQQYKFASLRANQLPNRRLDFDLKSLNLHLSTRVSEIVACAENMWEWVEDFQQRARAREKARARACEAALEGERKRSSGSGAASAPTGPGVETEDGWMKRELLSMSRVEFDVLVTRFEL